jgi:sulfite reductase beta subunit-like hemoprotein
VLETLEPLLADYAGNRNDGEAFGDFLLRQRHLPEPRSIPVQVLS